MSHSPTPQLYTVKAVTVNDEEIKYTNLTHNQYEHIKRTIWHCGILRRRDENTQELVSPFLLKQVLFIKQKGEDSGTMNNITKYHGNPATNK